MALFFKGKGNGMEAFERGYLSLATYSVNEGKPPSSMARPERDFPGGRDGAITVYKMDITGRCKLYYNPLINGRF